MNPTRAVGSEPGAGWAGAIAHAIVAAALVTAAAVWAFAVLVQQ